MPYANPTQQKNSQHQWYVDHRKQYNEQRRLRRQNNAQYIAEIKAQSKCGHCPENEPCCLDFHHTGDSKKDLNIAKAVRDFTLERLKKEVAKCVILCANCHRKEHKMNPV